MSNAQPTLLCTYLHDISVLKLARMYVVIRDIVYSSVCLVFMSCVFVYIQAIPGKVYHTYIVIHIHTSYMHVVLHSRPTEHNCISRYWYLLYTLSTVVCHTCTYGKVFFHFQRTSWSLHFRFMLQQTQYICYIIFYVYGV